MLHQPSAIQLGISGFWCRCVGFITPRWSCALGMGQKHWPTRDRFWWGSSVHLPELCYLSPPSWSRLGRPQFIGMVGSNLPCYHLWMLVFSLYIGPCCTLAFESAYIPAQTQVGRQDKSVFVLVSFIGIYVKELSVRNPIAARIIIQFAQSDPIRIIPSNWESLW